jgi:hypothetical protein
MRGVQIPEKLGARKGQRALLVLFIPSVDRYSAAIEQDAWVERALETLGNCFGGATAFPKAKGVWRDDARAGELVFDEPVIINCYTSELELERHVETLRDFLMDMGTKTNQGAVGLVIDRDYLEIQFPLEDENDG